MTNINGDIFNTLSLERRMRLGVLRCKYRRDTMMETITANSSAKIGLWWIDHRMSHREGATHD